MTITTALTCLKLVEKHLTRAIRVLPEPDNLVGTGKTNSFLKTCPRVRSVASDEPTIRLRQTFHGQKTIAHPSQETNTRKKKKVTHFFLFFQVLYFVSC